jgi:hypothetical protein
MLTLPDTWICLPAAGLDATTGLYRSNYRAGCRLPDPGCRRLRKRLESYFSGRQLFLKKHDIKFQLPYRMGENLDGVENTNEDEVFLQGQYVTSF